MTTKVKSEVAYSNILRGILRWFDKFFSCILLQIRNYWTSTYSSIIATPRVSYNELQEQKSTTTPNLNGPIIIMYKYHVSSQFEIPAKECVECDGGIAQEEEFQKSTRAAEDL